MKTSFPSAVLAGLALMTFSGGCAHALEIRSRDMAPTSVDTGTVAASTTDKTPDVTREVVRSTVPATPVAKPASDTPAGALELAKTLRALDPSLIQILVETLEKGQIDDPDAKHAEALDPTKLELLYPLNISPSGFDLNIRFTDINADFSQIMAQLPPDQHLMFELERIAQWGHKDYVRAVGLSSLARHKNPKHLTIFQEGKYATQAPIRMAALEALLSLGTPQAKQLIRDTAEVEGNPIIKAWAAYQIARMGDPRGRDILLELVRPDGWLVRAVAARYLCEVGMPDDYEQLYPMLARENNKYAKMELAGACLRLALRRQ